jgi:hypothetical protein
VRVFVCLIVISPTLSKTKSGGCEAPVSNESGVELDSEDIGEVNSALVASIE